MIIIIICGCVCVCLYCYVCQHEDSWTVRSSWNLYGSKIWSKARTWTLSNTATVWCTAAHGLTSWCSSLATCSISQNVTIHTCTRAAAYTDTDHAAITPRIMFDILVLPYTTSRRNYAGLDDRHQQVAITLFCCRNLSASAAVSYIYIWYDSVYLTGSKKLTGSQLSLLHGINKKIKCKTKNKKWWAW